MGISLYHCPQRLLSHPLVTCSHCYIPGENLCLQCFYGHFSADERETFGKETETDFFNYFFKLLLTWLCRTIDKRNFGLLSWVYAPLSSVAQDQSPVMDPAQGRTGRLLEGTWVVSEQQAPRYSFLAYPHPQVGVMDLL